MAAIAGVEVTLEELQQMDRQELQELQQMDRQHHTDLDTQQTLHCPAPVSPTSPVRKKRSRFAIDTPEKILEEARRKREEGGGKVTGSGGKKTSPPGKPNRKKYRKSY